MFFFRTIFDDINYVIFNVLYTIVELFFGSVYKCVSNGFDYGKYTIIIIVTSKHFSVTHFFFIQEWSFTCNDIFVLLLFNRSFMTVLEYRKLTKFFSYFFLQKIFFSVQKIIMTIYLDGNLNDFRVQIDGKNVPGDVH